MVIKTRCSGCGKILIEDDSNEMFVLCLYCNKFTPRGSNSYTKKLKGGNRKTMADKVKKERVVDPDKSLKCSKCKALKRAGPKRIEKWKGKVYLCRDCRPSKRKAKEAKKVAKASK